MGIEYYRTCPACYRESPLEIKRCACGMLLTGIDPAARVNEETVVPASLTAPSAEQPVTSLEALICPYDDCAQTNPPGSSRCLYCDRDLHIAPADRRTAPADAAEPVQETLTLFKLPQALSANYRIERALPTRGAEADLFVVVPLSGGIERIAKIYRHGIHPNREVDKRIARMGLRHRVEVFESGVSDGFTYLLMEYCKDGSLRDWLDSEKPSVETLRSIIEELAAAIDSVHRAGLIHRDLKPENILIRQKNPMDLILTDFGIASLQNATLRFTRVAHTLVYGAPEALSGVISNKTDWWSLGMILLECALGQHPFSGLSDAVILHHLTTRPIDLSAINDPASRKLLRGLLQRNPDTRWGFDEIQRWLSGDPSLPEPRGDEPASQIKYPYQIGDEKCFTTDQLAVALANHWRLAVSDLDNGLLMKWFRESLQDQNRVRFLMDLNLDRHLHVDVRLLRLIIDLAPGIPPVWRGDLLTLRNILVNADKALKNDDGAISWLNAICEYRVLEAYAAAGNTQIADIAAHWHGSLSAFNEAWNRLAEHIDTVNKQIGATRVEDMIYGQNGPSRPSPRQMHARLLAAAYDENWVSRLRNALAGEIPLLALACPWLLEIGNIATMTAPMLLVLESLLPEARKQDKRHKEIETRKEQEAIDRVSRLRTDLASNIASIQRIAGASIGNNGHTRLNQEIERFFGLSTQIRAMGRTEINYQKLLNHILRAEPVVHRISRLSDTLSERQPINQGWFNQRTYPAAGFIIFFVLTQIRNPSLIFLLLMALAGFVLWRFLPNFLTWRKIRSLAEKLKVF